MATRPTNERNPEIDVLRAFAILLVLIHHSHYSLPMTHYPVILQGTWSGVDLFFVISGFVISLSLVPLIALYHEGKQELISVLKSFFVRRLFRLLPLSMIALELNVVLTLVWNQSGQFGPWSEVRNEIIPILFYYYNYFLYFGGSGNMSWYWSLSIEEQFYFLYPFILVLVPNTRLLARLLVFAILFITFLVRPFTTPDFASASEKLWPLFTTPSHLRFDCILAGCVGGILFMKTGYRGLTDFAHRSRGWAKVLVSISLIGVAIAGAVLPRFELTGYPIILVFSLLLVMFASARVNLIPTFGLQSFLGWLGKRSYGVYLFHMIAIHGVNEWWFRILALSKNELTWVQGVAGLFLAWALTAVVVEALYRWVEIPTIESGRKLSARYLSVKV